MKRLFLAIRLPLFAALAAVCCSGSTRPATAKDAATHQEARLKLPKAAYDLRRQTLDSLYDQLALAKDTETAAFLTEAIEKLWLDSGSDTVNLLMERALLSVSGQKLDQAVAILTAVTAIAPDYPEGWNQLAVAHFLKEDYESALPPLIRALELEPRHFKAMEGLAVLMREIGQKKSALKAFRRALELNPHLGQSRQAIEELSREVEGQPI